MDARTPVIVGVGQVTNRRDRIVDPMELIEESSRRAEADAGRAILRRVQSVQIVSFLSWSYPDPAGALAERLGIGDGERLTTTAGGNTPQWLVSRACDQVASGELDAVLIAGAEALDSARQARAQGIQLNRGDRNAAPAIKVIGDARSAVGPGEMAAGVIAPVQIYPFYESALAAQAGRSPAEQRAFVGEFMAPATAVAASHPDYAWFPQERTPEELSTPGPSNRLIGEPYTKLLNAIMQVDQGAALILMSTEAAEAAGVPRDRWVFPWSGAECNDVFVTAERPQLTTSPAIEAAGRKAFEDAGVGRDDLATIDLYSCFPCAVQMGAKALGIALDDPRRLTVTGGLAYFGGPGNNYVTHAIAITAQRLREQPGAKGLVTALGWYVTKHAVGIYGSEPPPNGWRHPDCRREQEQIDAQALQIAMDHEGPATVEAMTVLHDRDRGPVAAPLFARLDDGRRAVAVPADPSLAASLSGTSLVGRKVMLRRGGGAAPVYEPV
jgi:acetyl-CoA C-acetyltransferase